MQYVGFSFIYLFVLSIVEPKKTYHNQQVCDMQCGKLVAFILKFEMQYHVNLCFN